MRSFYYHWEANRRLKACNDFIASYGGEDVCGSQILAQRDMIMLEVQYYKEYNHTLIKFWILLICGLAVLYNIWSLL